MHMRDPHALLRAVPLTDLGQTTLGLDLFLALLMERGDQQHREGKRHGQSKDKVGREDEGGEEREEGCRGSHR